MATNYLITCNTATGQFTCDHFQPAGTKNLPVCKGDTVTFQATDINKPVTLSIKKGSSKRNDLLSIDVTTAGLTMTIHSRAALARHVIEGTYSSGMEPPIGTMTGTITVST